jgi:hypothetical protein
MTALRLAAAHHRHILANEQRSGTIDDVAATECFSSSSCCGNSTNAVGMGLAARHHMRGFVAEAATTPFLYFVCCRTEMGCMGCNCRRSGSTAYPDEGQQRHACFCGGDGGHKHLRKRNETRRSGKRGRGCGGTSMLRKRCSSSVRIRRGFSIARATGH